MIRLHIDSDGLIVGHLRQVLADHGIDCLVRNEYLQGGVGELPPNECWPELWIIDERDLEPARRLLHALLGPPPAKPPWTCAQCGEGMEGQFSHCWQCGSEREDD